MEDIDYTDLHPGIRNTVKMLRVNGFETISSGEGVSKADRDTYHLWDCVSSYLHVYCEVYPSDILAQADRLQALLDRERPCSRDWIVEASYRPKYQTGKGATRPQCLLLAKAVD